MKPSGKGQSNAKADQSSMEETIGDVKISVDEGDMEQMVNEFNIAVTEIVGSENSGKIKVEYEKLYRSLKKSREAEKRLMNKCRDLHVELMRNANKISAMANQANEIASLQRENKRAWESSDEMKKRDDQNTDKIRDLKAEVDNLTRLLEKCGGLEVAGSSQFSFKDLMIHKNDLEQKLEGRNEEISQLKVKLDEAVATVNGFDDVKQEYMERINALNYDLVGKNADFQKEVRRKEKLEMDLRKSRQETEDRDQQIAALNASLEKLTQEMRVGDLQIRDLKVVVDRNQKELAVLTEQYQRAQDDYDKAAGRASKAVEELQEMKAVFKQMEEDATQLKMDMMKGSRQRDTLQRKMHQLEETKKELEEQRDMYSSKVGQLEKTVESLKKELETANKNVLHANREKDKLDSTCRKAVGEAQKQGQMAKHGDQTIRNMETEMSNYRAEAHKQRQIIYQLEKDRDRYINEAADLTQKVLKHIEEVKARESEIFDLRKQNATIETKFKQQQNLYEAVRSDRNLYSKNLIESQDEITEMRRKLDVNNHTMQQLRDELGNRENVMVKLKLENQQIMSERDKLNNEMCRMREQLGETKVYIGQQQRESAKLLQIIKESDTRAAQHKKDIENITQERDILGTQLIRRNDELALLYEKIRIQESVLVKGEKGYNQRVDDIRILKVEIRRLRRLVNKANTSMHQSEQLKNEFFYTQRELLRERARVKALEEELSRPLNLHRWRRLEGADPSTFELLKKTHFLQKRLIRKITQLARAHNVIEEKDKLYMELKRILSRQPGGETFEKMNAFKDNLKVRSRQMQAMAGELNMFAVRENEQKFETQRLAQELADVKKKYYIEKRKNNKTNTQLSLLAGLPPTVSHERSLSTVAGKRLRKLPNIQPIPRAERTAGGGFKLSTEKIDHS